MEPLYITRSMTGRLVITPRANATTYVSGPYRTHSDAMDEMLRRQFMAEINKTAFVVGWIAVVVVVVVGIARWI